MQKFDTRQGTRKNILHSEIVCSSGIQTYTSEDFTSLINKMPAM